MSKTDDQGCVQPRIAVRFRYMGNAQELYENGEAGDAPQYATPCSAGLDLRACMESDEAVIPAGGRLAIPAGIAVEPMVQGVAGFVYSRSGLGTKKGLTVSQGVGVIDPDYRGEIIVSLLNTSGGEQRLRRGERIAQLVFQPFFQAELQQVAELGDTQRGTGGFGHTGRI